MLTSKKNLLAFWLSSCKFCSFPICSNWLSLTKEDDHLACVTYRGGCSIVPLLGHFCAQSFVPSCFCQPCTHTHARYVRARTLSKLSKHSTQGSHATPQHKTLLSNMRCAQDALCKRSSTQVEHDYFAKGPPRLRHQR